MKNVKKLFAVAMATVMTASLFVGCGSKSTSTSGNEKDSVTVWTYPHYRANPDIKSPGYEDLLKDLIGEYKKTHPNVDVKYEVLSWDEGDQKFDIALNSGNPPDVFYTTSQAKYVKTGLALPLDEYITDEDKKDFEPFALDRFKIDGKQYGLPTWISVHCLGGNKKYFEDAGIDYKKIMQSGWTWDEFKAATKKMTKQNSGKQTYGFVFNGKDEEMLRHFLMADGLGTGISDDGKFTFTGSKVNDTVTYLKSLRDEGIIPKEAGGIDAQKIGDMLSDGTAAIIGRVGPYEINFNNKRNDGIDQGKIKGEKREVILLPFPHGKDGKDCVYGDCGGYMSFRQKNAKSKQHEKNVADLMKVLTGTSASIGSANVFTTPARKSGQELIKGKIKADDNNLAFMTRAISIVQSRPIVTPEIDAKYSKVKKEALVPLFQAFLAGEKSPAEVAKGIEDKAKEVFGN